MLDEQSTTSIYMNYNINITSIISISLEHSINTLILS